MDFGTRNVDFSSLSPACVKIELRLFCGVLSQVHFQLCIRTSLVFHVGANGCLQDVHWFHILFFQHLMSLSISLPPCSLSRLSSRHRFRARRSKRQSQGELLIRHAVFWTLMPLKMLRPNNSAEWGLWGGRAWQGEGRTCVVMSWEKILSCQCNR